MTRPAAVPPVTSAAGRRAASWAAACLLAAPAVAPAQGTGAGGLHTNRPDFRIPYTADPQELSRLGAAQVRLLVSTDRGRNWGVVETVGPAAARFGFNAPADGEYWFSVQTLDAAGRPVPAGLPVTPGLKVTVDRAEPTLSLSLTDAGDGTLRAGWSAGDAHLDPSAVRVEVAEDGVNFRPVPAPAVPAAAVRVPARADTAVRVTVADRAGNTASAERRASEVMSRHPTPARTARVPDAGYGAVDTPASPFAPRPAAPQPAAPQSGDAPPTPRPAGELLLNARRFSIAYEVDAVGPSGVGGVEIYITPDGGQRWFSYGSDADRVSPFVVEVPEEGEYGFAIRVRSGAGLGDPPPRPGDAPDVRVAVDLTPPRVDLFAPRQGPTELKNGTGGVGLSLAWRTDEARPARESVRLHHAPSPGGPWTLIRDWSPDRGEMTWPIPPGTPAKVWVRVTARDEAGNQSAATTPKPVLIDRAKPRPRILGVDVVR